MLNHEHSFFPLLTNFSEFYKVLASIRQAILQERLPLLLCEGEQMPLTDSSEIVMRVNHRLSEVLSCQLAQAGQALSPRAIKYHHIASYAMAALADEILVLELNWYGSQLWLDMLLEHKLFKSRIAGSKIFDLIRQLIDLPTRDSWHADLASVFLMLLQLGFKGQHRGSQGEKILHDLRLRLFRIVLDSNIQAQADVAFPQAYLNVKTNPTSYRLAPLSRWISSGTLVLLVYLILSSMVWLHLTRPIQSFFEKSADSEHARIPAPATAVFVPPDKQAFDSEEPGQ